MEPYTQEIIHKYMDPLDVDEVMEKLHATQTNSEIRSLIEKTYPTWLVHSTDRYSPDYPHFQKNWELIIDNRGLKPQEIVLVDFLLFNSDQHKLIMEFAERMTKRGYCVRRKEEFVGCEKCGKAVPRKSIWKRLVELKFPVPKKWSPTCSQC